MSEIMIAISDDISNMPIMRYGLYNIQPKCLNTQYYGVLIHFGVCWLGSVGWGPLGPGKQLWVCFATDNICTGI